MTQTVEMDRPVAIARRSHRRRWVIAGVVALLVAGGVITSIAVSFHYLHAKSLSSSGGGWIAPDAGRARDVRAGPYDASIVPPRCGEPQTFEMELDNLSDVSQTVLGMTDAKALADPQLTGEPQTLQLSSTAIYPASDRPVRYTSNPVTIPPNGAYLMRFTEVTRKGLWMSQRSEYIQAMTLRVRVGAFTRTETIDFGGLIMEIRSESPVC